MFAYTIISIILNIALGGLVLSTVLPKLRESIRKKKNLRETRLKRLVRKEVRDYLKELQK